MSPVESKRTFVQLTPPSSTTDTYPPNKRHKHASPKISTFSSNNHLQTQNTDLFFNIWVNCGKMALEFNNNFKIAINCFKNALNYSPTNNHVINLLIDSLITYNCINNNNTGILETIDLINEKMNKSQLLKNDLSLCSKLANCYMILSDYEKANSILQSAMEIKSNDPLIWLTLGKCLNRLNQIDQSKNALNNSLRFLPKDLNSISHIDIARDVHLELVKLAIDSNQLDSARNELGSVLSLPKPQISNIYSKNLSISLIQKLIKLFTSSNINLLHALYICDISYPVYPDEQSILLMHSNLLLMENKSFFNPNRARRLLHGVIQSDKYYLDSQNIADYIHSSKGDFLPWLLISQCFLFLNYINIAFDCLEVATRKITNPSILPNLKILASKMLKLAKPNTSFYIDVENFINAIDSYITVHSKVISIATIVELSYDERCRLFNNQTQQSVDTKPKLVQLAEIIEENESNPGVFKSLKNPETVQNDLMIINEHPELPKSAGQMKKIKGKPKQKVKLEKSGNSKKKSTSPTVEEIQEQESLQALHGQQISEQKAHEQRLRDIQFNDKYQLKPSVQQSQQQTVPKQYQQNVQTYNSVQQYTPQLTPATQIVQNVHETSSANGVNLSPERTQMQGQGQFHVIPQQQVSQPMNQQNMPIIPQQQQMYQPPPQNQQQQIHQQYQPQHQQIQQIQQQPPQHQMHQHPQQMHIQQQQPQYQMLPPPNTEMNNTHPSNTNINQLVYQQQQPQQQQMGMAPPMAPPMGMQMGIPMSVPMNVPMGMQMSVPMNGPPMQMMAPPMGVPMGPPMNGPVPVMSMPMPMPMDNNPGFYGFPVQQQQQQQ